MSIWEIDKLLLFIAFVIPGFVSLKTYELFFPSEKTDSGKQLVDAIAYSCINYALLFWFIVDIEKSSVKNTASFFYFAFYFFVFFLAPIIWVIIWKSIRNTKTFQKNAPHPIQKPWDYVFSKNESFWVKVTLKNGTILGGRFSSKSFASSAPAEEQLYLEESWVIKKEGGFDRIKKRTAGIMITSSEISYLEFFEFYEQQTKGNKND